MNSLVIPLLCHRGGLKPWEVHTVAPTFPLEASSPATIIDMFEVPWTFTTSNPLTSLER